MHGENLKLIGRYISVKIKTAVGTCYKKTEAYFYLLRGSI